MENIVYNSIRNILKRIYFFVIGFWFTKDKFENYKKEFLLLRSTEDDSFFTLYKHNKLAKINKPIEYYYDLLFKKIEEQIKAQKGFTIIRASDGEAYFLQGKAIGNISRRHYTKDSTLNKVNLDIFKNGLLQCDLRLWEMDKKNRAMFVKIYGKNVFSEIPFECVYALFATKRILKNNWRIGIIGSGKKLEIIQKLLLHPEYQQYIGRSSFEDYISVPETGTANDPEGLIKHIQSQLKDNIDIYFVGIGIAKLAVLHRLKENSKAVFLDAGAGVSALAGFAGYERQYLAGWTNFRLKDYDYSNVDTMDAEFERGRTVYL